MKEHLSPRQIEDWLIGDRPAEVRQHVETCPACSEEVSRALAPLAMFGSAVRGWSVHVAALPVAATPTRLAWRPLLTLAALLAVAAVPAYRHHNEERRIEAAAIAAQDDVLLKQVATGISRSVPAPMEPLAQLMTNN